MKTLRVDADTAGILERLGRLRPDDRRRWGTLTSAEMLVHVADSYRVALGERPAAAAPMPLAALAKWIAFRLPLPWPPGVPTRPEVDPRRAGSRPGAFAADLADLDALVRRYAASGATLEGRPHPLLGPCSADDWLRWGWLHADHHLRQFGR